jgi:hypothetical protein
MNQADTQQQVMRQGMDYDSPDAEYTGDREVTVTHLNGDTVVRKGVGAHAVLSRHLVTHSHDKRLFNRSMAKTKRVANTGEERYASVGTAPRAGSAAATPLPPPPASSMGVAPPPTPQQDRAQPLDAELARAHPDLAGLDSFAFALEVQDRLPPAAYPPRTPVLQKVCFIPCDAGDIGACKAAVLREQTALLGVQQPASAYLATTTDAGAAATLPGKWSLQGTTQGHRALQFWPYTYKGEPGIVTILLTLPLKEAEPLCETSYIHFKFIGDTTEDKGISIRCVPGTARGTARGTAESAVLTALREAGGRLELKELRRHVPSVDDGNRWILSHMRDVRGTVMNRVTGVWELTELGRNEADAP